MSEAETEPSPPEASDRLEDIVLTLQTVRRLEVLQRQAALRGTSLGSSWCQSFRLIDSIGKALAALRDGRFVN